MQDDKTIEAMAREQVAEITRGAVDIHSADALQSRIEESIRKTRPLRVKAGFDPTAPDLHLGHTVLLTRMRRFQRFGHTPVFVIGDFTASIGDPTGRNATRRTPDRETILRNAETYKEQVFKILDPEKTEVRFNSEWLSDLGVDGIIHLASHYTLARMLERDDFKQRFRGQLSISIHELLYPLVQAYDSVALKADVELGGTDQLFNLLVGREIMRDYGLEPQIVITSPLLEGIDAREVDGEIVGEKMSKSLGNYVGVTDSPKDMFGKLMSISDVLMWRYYELLSDLDASALATLREDVAASKVHPRQAKVGLASEMVRRYHGIDAAKEAEKAFDDLHRRRELPSDIPQVKLAFPTETLSLARLLADTGLASSSSEARRLMKQGGVRVDGERFLDPMGEIERGEHLIQVGKRKFLRVLPA